MIFIYAELLLRIRCDRGEIPVSSKWGRGMCLHLAGRSTFSQFLSVRVSSFLFQAFHLSSDFQRVFLWLEKNVSGCCNLVAGGTGNGVPGQYEGNTSTTSSMNLK